MIDRDSLVRVLADIVLGEDENIIDPVVVIRRDGTAELGSRRTLPDDHVWWELAPDRLDIVGPDNPDDYDEAQALACAELWVDDLLYGMEEQIAENRAREQEAIREGEHEARRWPRCVACEQATHPQRIRLRHGVGVPYCLDCHERGLADQ